MKPCSCTSPKGEAGEVAPAPPTSRQLSEAEVLHGAGGHQRLLRVVEDVGRGVHAHVEVGDVDTHGLLAHG